MTRTQSVRDFVPNQSMGSDARESLGGEAKPTPSQKATNETKHSEVAAPPTKGSNGGLNTKS